MSEIEKCPVDVAYGSGYHFRECGRPVKRNGKCGVHAAADERRERNDAARLAKARERRRLAEEKVARHAALLEAEAAVERVRALLDGAPMVAQAEVRRALEPTTPPTVDPRTTARDETRTP